MSCVTLGALQFSASLGGESICGGNGSASLHSSKEGSWQMSLEGPLPASPLPNLPSLSWGPPLPGKLPRPLLPFRIKSIPTLAPVNLPASGLTLPSTPTLSLFWSFSPPCPPPSSFTWVIPAYPPLTATGHHLTSGKPTITPNHHASSSGLSPGSHYTRPAMWGVSICFLLLLTGILEAGDNAHTSFSSRQPRSRQDTGPGSFRIWKPFEIQGGDKCGPKPKSSKLQSFKFKTLGEGVMDEALWTRQKLPADPSPTACSHSPT